MALPAPTPIETPRLLLRRVEPDDLPALLAINGDELVTHHLPYTAWRGPADAQAWFERMSVLQATGAALQLVVMEKATGMTVGTCLVFRHDDVSARAEIGYVLGRPHWGRGVMREALQALIGCAFDVWRLRRLEAEVNPTNTASVHLLERLGFTREGLLRQRWVGPRGAHDVFAYGLLRGEHAEPEPTPHGR